MTTQKVYKVQYIDTVIVEAYNRKEAIDRGFGGAVGADVKKKIICKLLRKVYGKNKNR